MNKIEKFAPEVIDELQYYVYRLIDPRNGNTFYVGKGKGNRLFSHVFEAEIDNDDDEVSAKIETIRDIQSRGYEVIHVIHRWGLTEKVLISNLFDASFIILFDVNIAIISLVSQLIWVLFTEVGRSLKE